jgi:O-antigen ligase
MKTVKESLRKQEKGFLEKIVSWGILTIFIVTPLLFSPWRIAAAVTSKQYFFIGIVDILVVLWTWLAVQDTRYRLGTKNLVALLPIGLLIISMIVSTFIGADRATSLFSTIERGVGLVFTLHALVFTVIVASMIRVQGLDLFKKIAQAVLFSAVVVAGVTFFTKEAFDVGITWLNESAGGAMLGNSTIAGAYFVFAVFLGLFLWIKETVRSQKVLYGMGIALLIISPMMFNVKWLFGGDAWAHFIQSPLVIIGQARAAVGATVIGIIIAWLSYLILVSKTKSRVWVGRIGIAIILIGLAVTAAQVFQSGSRVQNEFISQVGRNRILFWKEAFAGIKERPVFGWGPENFKIVHQKYFEPALTDPKYGSEIWVDKPHSTLIELLVTQGIIGFLLYISVILFLVHGIVRIVKRGSLDAVVGSILLGMIFAFVLQNQLAFDSIISTVCFFMLVGVIVGFQEVNVLEKKNEGIVYFSKILGWTVTCIIIPVWIFAAYLPSRKVIEAKKVFDAPVNKRTGQYEALFSGPGSYALRTDTGMMFYTLAESYLAQRADIEANPNFIALAVPELQALIDVGKKSDNFSKNDFRFALAMTIFQETEIGIIGKYSIEKLELMDTYAKRALALSPTNPYGYLVYSKTLLYSEKIKEARSALDQAIKLSPIIKESHDQKIEFERVYGTKSQQEAALADAMNYVPGYQSKQ